MPVVLIGHEDGQITKAVLPDSDDPNWTDQQRFLAIMHDDGANQGVWANHKGHSGTHTPAWIESDDSTLARRLAAYYDCPIGRPEQGTEPVAEGVES